MAILLTSILAIGAIVKAAIIATGNAILEYHFYKKLVIPAYNFLMFNVVE